MASPELEIQYCLRCGAHLETAERFGRPRRACPACGWIYFADPKVAAAALVETAQGVLLVRRANDPLRGLWTLPAGFVDAGEDPARAAERECLEETGLEVRVTGLIDALAGREHPRGADIILFYRAEVIGGSLLAADDVDGADFFQRGAFPPLAFSTTQTILGLK
jgi:ADP-ribose pyrophosphatase YjhB (NUDIX family)